MRYGHDLVCRWCGGSFFICSSCFRGQNYCSPLCRKLGYACRRREARKKYAASLRGRTKHRERNKLYRVYGRQHSSVMDPSSDKSPNQVFVIRADPQRCVVCGCRRINEDLELFTVPPD